MATVQIRNLDDEAYGVLKSRAAESGRSLQEYLRLLLEEQARKEAGRDHWRRYRIDVGWPTVPVDTTVETTADRAGAGQPESVPMSEIVAAIHAGRDR